MLSLDKITVVKDQVKLEKTYQDNDLIVLLDISGSMASEETVEGSGGFLNTLFGGGKTEKRIDQAKQLLIAHYTMFSKYVKNKPLKVILFDNNTQYFEISSQQELENTLRKTYPQGSTDTAKALRTAFDKVGHQAVVIVYTDGSPNSQSDVTKVIVDKTKTVDDDKFGVLFAQIGNDTSASRFLKYLDDDLGSLTNDKDIVGTMSYQDLTNATIEDMLNEALYG